MRGEIVQQEGHARYLEERARMAAIHVQLRTFAPTQPLWSRSSQALLRSFAAARAATEIAIVALG